MTLRGWRATLVEESNIFPFRRETIHRVNKRRKVLLAKRRGIDNSIEGGQDKTRCPAALVQLKWLNLMCFITSAGVLLCEASGPFTPTPCKTNAIYPRALIGCSNLHLESPQGFLSLQVGVRFTLFLLAALFFYYLSGKRDGNILFSRIKRL